MNTCQDYLFICTHKPEIYNSLEKHELGNLLSIFSRNALYREQLSATGSCAPHSSSFRQIEASWN